MQHPFFKETAEELVERLFNEWLKSNIFTNNIPLNNPIIRQDTIDQLKKLDKRLQEVKLDTDYTGWTETETTLDKKLDEQMINSAREHCVLLNLAKTFSYFFNRSLTDSPPKPTHRQTHQKLNHLRLVING